MFLLAVVQRSGRNRSFLGLCAGEACVASVILAAFDTAGMAASLGVGRLADCHVVRFWRLVGEFVGSAGAEWMPAVLGVPHDLTSRAGVIEFFGAAVVVNVVFASALLLVLVAPWLSLARRRRAALAASERVRRALAVTIFVLLVVPGVGAWVHDAGFVLGQTAIIATVVAIAVAAWLALLAVALLCPAVCSRLTRVRYAVAPAVVFLSVIGIAAASAFEPDARPAPVGRTPNMVLISIDSLRPDHLGCYGYDRPTSPTIDRLAREGAVFERAYSPTSWTLPAHATMLTGLPPESHRLIDDGYRMPAEIDTLAAALRRAGYQTAGFVAAPYLNAMYGFAHGFDYYDDFTAGALTDADSHTGTRTPEQLEAIRRWLDANAGPSKRPFFLFVHLWDVHYDYKPPPPFDTMFDPDYTGEITGDAFLYDPRIHPGMDQRDLDHVLALYDGEIRYTDTQIARLLEYLQRAGDLDDTVIVVTSDHGDEFFEHGEKGHRNNLFDTTVRVPLIVRYPARIEAGQRVRGIARLMDIPNTMLDLADLPPMRSLAREPRLAARSLMALVRGEERAGGRVAGLDLHGKQKGVVYDRYKLLRDPQQSRVLLFDLLRDPGERVDLAGTARDDVARMQESLQAWVSAWPHVGRARAIRPARSFLARLRSLGYMD